MSPIVRRASSPLRVDPFVALAQAVGHAHIPVQNGIMAQRLPLGVVDLARQQRHGGMVAQRVIELHGEVLLAPHPVPPAAQTPLGARDERILAIGDTVAAGVFALHRLCISRSRLVPEIERQQLGQRIALLAERGQRIEPRAAVVHLDLIAEERRGQRLAVAREDIAAPRGKDLVGEDPARQTVGVVGHLRREELHPDQAREDQRRDQNEDGVEQMHAEEDVAFDRGALLGLRHGQSSMISPGAAGSYNGMPRSASARTTAEWVVERKLCS